MTANFPERVVGTLRAVSQLCRIFFFLFSWLATCFISNTSLAQETGTPWTGAHGIKEQTSKIMARQKESGKRPRPQKGRFKPDFQALMTNPDSPDVPSWPPSDASPAPPAPSTGNPQTFGLNFT